MAIKHTSLQVRRVCLEHFSSAQMMRCRSLWTIKNAGSQQQQVEFNQNKRLSFVLFLVCKVP